VKGTANAATTKTLDAGNNLVKVYQPVSSTTTITLPPLADWKNEEIYVEVVNLATQSRVGGGSVAIRDAGDSIDGSGSNVTLATIGNSASGVSRALLRNVHARFVYSDSDAYHS
jgi:hypothetical protein